jgi:hypothetical protein
MKCLMRMFAEQDKGVIFYETVINLKWQKHSYIECVPLPWEQFEDIPQYFKVRDIQRSHVFTLTLPYRSLSWHQRPSGLSTRN